MSADKIYTDMVRPREVVLRGPAADLTSDGLDMTQGTRTRCQTHTAPTAVVAMTCASLRQQGAFSMLPRRSGRGYTSPREGVEMT
ncbi:hypothetical protein GCM10009753_66740 [Streptantibioticus ferralitis]